MPAFSCSEISSCGRRQDVLICRRQREGKRDRERERDKRRRLAASLSCSRTQEPQLGRPEWPRHENFSTLLAEELEGEIYIGLVGPRLENGLGAYRTPLLHLLSRSDGGRAEPQKAQAPAAPNAQSAEAWSRLGGSL